MLFIIFDIEVTKFSFNLAWVSLPPCSKNVVDMVQQRLNRGLTNVQLVRRLKLDTFTLVTVTFQWFGRFKKKKKKKKPKISMTPD